MPGAPCRWEVGLASVDGGADRLSVPGRPLRIAYIGQRGLPATFGGIERHVEEIGARLAARGHDITVFCRSNYGPSRQIEYRGVRLRHLPTVTSKHFDAIVHSALSTLDAMTRHFDVVHYHALGPSLVAPLPRYLSSARVVLTVHGLDQQRAKWGRAASAVLGTAAWMSHRVPDATIVVSEDLALHYRRRGGRVVHVANGVAPPAPAAAGDVVAGLGLQGRPYVLFVGRLVPEKAPDLLVRAFRRLPGDIRLVVAGGSSFTDDYVGRISVLAEGDPRVVMPGYVYGRALDELYANAAAFVLPSALEGLPLTLLEAASHATPVVASSIPPHLEVLQQDGPGHRLFRSGDETDLLEALERALADSGAERAGAEELRSRVLRDYSWDTAALATEAVYHSIVGTDPGSPVKRGSFLSRSGRA